MRRPFLLLLIAALNAEAAGSPPPVLFPIAARMPPRSLSIGRAFRGRLLNARLLKDSGDGYRVARPLRDTHYGTDELVGGIIELASRMRQADPRMPPLAVGDLSSRSGGRVSRHKSHQSGRDADLGFFATDLSGRPAWSDGSIRFDARGRGVPSRRGLRFDARRNWTLVEGILSNAHFGDKVQYIFVSRDIRKLLLRHARTSRAEPSLIRKARWALVTPAGPAGRHDNHFHVRIACSERDLAAGCRD